MREREREKEHSSTNNNGGPGGRPDVPPSILGLKPHLISTISCNWVRSCGVPEGVACMWASVGVSKVLVEGVIRPQERDIGGGIPEGDLGCLPGDAAWVSRGDSLLSRFICHIYPHFLPLPPS